MSLLFGLFSLLRESWLSRFLVCACLFAPLLQATQSVAGTINFLVAEFPGLESHNDSYVLPLSDPDDIAYARRLIAEGPQIGPALVVAKIAEGSDGINRNVLAAGEPLWSWRVTEFSGFADFTIEILDGWPGFIEADVQGWLDNTNSAIGFWNYTIVDELVPVPEPSGFLLLSFGVLFLLPPARRFFCR